MNLLDSHCHLDLMPNPTAIAEETDREGIVAVSVTNAPSVFSYTHNLCRKFLHLRAALGLHPELVATHHVELPLFLEQLPLTRFIGEVGLDFVTSDASLRSLQRKVFSSILSACSDAGNKILTVHSRRAATAVLDELGNGFNGTVILHWFSGSKRELARAGDAGCFFSVNSAMLSSKAGMSLVEAIPKERMLTETDGPFAKIGGKPSTPLSVKQTMASLAQFWRVPEREARELVGSNFVQLLGEVSPTHLTAVRR